MAKLLDLKCPECKGVFEFLRHPSDEPLPERCELCGAWMGDDSEKVPVLHLKIGTAKGKTGDILFRKMEDASIARAEDAAEMVGASVSEMSAIKITDMKDNQRAGDNATKVNVHEAERRLSTQYAGPQMQRPGSDAEAAARAEETRSGPAALSTRQFFDKSRSSGEMSRILRESTANGQMAKV